MLSGQNMTLTFEFPPEKFEFLLKVLKEEGVVCKDKEAKILTLAKQNNFFLLKDLLQEPIKHDWHTDRDTDRNYALHWAVKNRNLDMLCHLLEFKADYNVKNSNDDTPLDLALQEGYVDIALNLLEKKDSIFKNQSSYLNKAIRNDQESLYVKLLERQQSWNHNDGDPPLHIAATKNNLSMVGKFVGGTPHIYDSKGKTVLENGRRFQAEHKEFSLDHVKIIHHLQNRQHKMELEEAIVTNDFDKVRDKISYSLQNEILKKNDKKPLSLASGLLHGKKTEIIQYLVERGGVLSEQKYEAKVLHDFEMVSSKIDTYISDIKKQCSEKLAGVTDLKTEYSLPKTVLEIIVKELKSDFVAPDQYFQMDLFALLQSLLNAITHATHNEELKQEILKIFAYREDAILNSSMDYCYHKKSHANQICYQIAALFCEKDASPYDVLLKKAKTEKSTWFDPSMGADATQLPDPSLFFRVGDNEIHTYEDVIFTQAISRLKEGKQCTNHVWTGTDARNIQPVPPLKRSSLTLMKQRSDTLCLLIEYVEKLDQISRASKDFVTIFLNLTYDLFANSVRYAYDLVDGAKNEKKNHATHEDADSKNDFVIDQFAEWWTALNDPIKNKIKALEGGENNQTLGEVIDIILCADDFLNRQSNTKYCIQMKAEILEKVLKDKNIIQQLKELEGNVKDEKNEVEVTEQVLDGWALEIEKELKQDKNIFVQRTGKFPSIVDFGAINLVLMKKFGYPNFIGHKLQQKKDHDFLVEFILAETNNDILSELQDALKHDIFFEKDDFFKALTMFQIHKNDMQQKYPAGELIYDSRWVIDANTLSLKSRMSVFELAILKEHTIFLRYFLDKRQIYLYDKNKDGKTFLQIAHDNHKDYALSLIQQSMKNDAFYSLQETVGNLDVASTKFLLNECKYTENQVVQALRIAIQKESVDIVKLLLEREVNIFEITHSGSVYTFAKNTKKDKIVSVLFEYSQKKPWQAIELAIKACNYTFISDALSGSPQKLEGWDRADATGLYPLHNAVNQDEGAITKILLEAKSDVNIKSGLGTTALDLALQKNFRGNAIQLLKSGANVCKTPEVHFAQMLKDKDNELAKLFSNNFPQCQIEKDKEPEETHHLKPGWNPYFTHP